MEWLWQKGSLVDVVIKRWSMRSVLDKKDLNLSVDTEIPNIVYLGNKRLLPVWVENTFLSYEGHARRTLKANSFEFPIGRNHFVPLPILSTTMTNLNEDRDKWIAFANTFFDSKNAEGYLSQVKVMQDKYPILKEFTYLSANEARSKFDFNVAVYNLSLADSAAKSDIAQRTQKQISEFLDDVNVILKDKIMCACNQIKEKIDAGKIDMRSMKHVHSWIEQTQLMNFMENKEISEILTSLKKELPDNSTDLQLLPLETLSNTIDKTLEILQPKELNRKLFA